MSSKYRIVQDNVSQTYSVQRKVFFLPWFTYASNFKSTATAKNWLNLHLKGGKKVAKFTVIEEIEL